MDELAASSILDRCRGWSLSRSESQHAETMSQRRKQIFEMKPDRPRPRVRLPYTLPRHTYPLSDRSVVDYMNSLYTFP